MYQAVKDGKSQLKYTKFFGIVFRIHPPRHSNYDSVEGDFILIYIGRRLDVVS